MERIIAAAIHRGGLILTLPAPARHHTIMKIAVEQLELPAPIGGVEGFITNTGRFVNRVEALHIAKSAGQAASYASLTALYSEDLW